MAGTGDGIHAHHTRGRQFSRPIFFWCTTITKTYPRRRYVFGWARTVWFTPFFRNNSWYHPFSDTDLEWRRTRKRKLPLPCPTKTGRRYYRVSSTHYAYKQHLRQIRKNQRQRFFRIITHPQRVGLDSRKHITQFECNSTQRSSRRLCW